ncbi:MAG: CoA transferase, partial [Acetobacteraceae bacterium]|nr:CoA transferase [Acetobacteraceae bacterium]
MRERLAAIFRTRSRAAWCALMEGTDVCFAPVLTMEEALRHPHARARAAFVELDGVTQPAPAPRFSRTEPEASAPRENGADTEEVLREAGFSEAERRALREAGVVR